jgi:hypothetical protein
MDDVLRIDCGQLVRAFKLSRTAPRQCVERLIDLSQRRLEAAE